MIVVPPLAAAAFGFVLLAASAVFTWLQEAAAARELRRRWDPAEAAHAADSARWDAHAAQWEAELTGLSRGDGSLS